MAPMSFSDFPDDVQLNILSFLRPIEISRFACTCRRFAALCSHSSPSSELWFAICDRRWGSRIQLRRWSVTPSPSLYKTLVGWEHLVGFWRCIGSGTPKTEFLVFFEWSTSRITGSRISPSPVAASYSVHKIPLLCLHLSPAGKTLSYRHPDTSDPLSDSIVIPVRISFMGSYHFVVHDVQRKKKKKKKKKMEWLVRKRWEGVEFVKIADYSPPTRPLQALWKGISENMNLQSYRVTHDVWGIACWRVGDTAEPSPGYTPVFWTSNSTILESPFSEEEHAIYSMRKHMGSTANMDWEIVSRILRFYCSYDLVDSSGDPRDDEGRIWEYKNGTFGFGLLSNDFIIDLKHITLDGYTLDDLVLPDLVDLVGSDPRNVEGRIWEYEDGTFGFGFLRNDFIIDLKHIALDGYLLDDVESSH